MSSTVNVARSLNQLRHRVDGYTSYNERIPAYAQSQVAKMNSRGTYSPTALQSYVGKDDFADRIIASVCAEKSIDLDAARANPKLVRFVEGIEQAAERYRASVAAVHASVDALIKGAR